MQQGTFQRSFSLPLSNRRKSRHGEYFKRGRGLQGYRGGNTRPQLGGLKKEHSSKESTCVQRSSKVNVGQTVREGEEIAKFGMTGYTLLPHLHFYVFILLGEIFG
jgi:hypothetical protein